MANPKSQEEHEAELLVGVGSQGTAALALLRNMLRALRAKGVLSEIEIAAICDAAAEQARGSGDPVSEKYAESVRRAIRQIEGSILGPSTRDSKH